MVVAMCISERPFVTYEKLARNYMEMESLFYLFKAIRFL